MSHFDLKVIERNGDREHIAINADDYEELAEKVAAKAGVAIDPDGPLALEEVGNDE